jgi:hypothetical protein
VSAVLEENYRAAAGRSGVVEVTVDIKKGAVAGSTAFFGNRRGNPKADDQESRQ